MSPDEIATRLHHGLVRIHSFANGSGRHGRLITDLLLRELGRPPFTWGSARLEAHGETRTQYIAPLRRADQGEFDALRGLVRS